MKFKPTHVAFTAIIFILICLVLNCYTIVQDGTAKTGLLMGKISNKVYTSGFYIVNPLMSFKTHNIKDLMLKKDDVSIPSQDKFVSSADFAVQFSIDPNKLPTLARTFGSDESVIDKLLEQPLQSFIREAGRNVPKAQDLFLAKVQDSMQTMIETKLRDNAAKYGLHVQNVFIKDVELPSVIKGAIEKTKRLEEQVAQEQANLDKEKLIYQRQVEQAKANTTKAAQLATQLKISTNAESYKTKTNADAALYAKNQEAKANISLAKSLTPELLQLKKINVQMQQAKSWNGSVPSTVMGNNSALPLFNLK